MADKNFKVKTGLSLPQALPIDQGGTGQTSSDNALNALLPAQTNKAGKVLSTDGTSTAWSSIPNEIVYSDTEPSNPVDGQVWIDTNATTQLFDPNIIRRSSFTSTSGQTDYTVSVPFVDGYEQVYFNGVLLQKTEDYTTSSNNTITLTVAAETGDLVEVLAVTNLNSVDTYTQSEIDTNLAEINTSLATKANILVGTTSQRPSSAFIGDMYYDTTLQQMLNYSAIGWITIGSVGLTIQGGTLSSDSTYYYRTFTSTGSLIVGLNITADILVVAGGGAGGSAGGGGGAGGLIGFTSQSLVGGNTYSVTIGAGGTGSNGSGGMPTSGNNSSFGSLTAAVGGGYAAGYNGSVYYNAAVGGSGGGGAYNGAGQYAVGTSGQGNSGNNGYQDPGGGAPRSGGGGGGAGGSATNGGIANTGGNGGVGSSNYSSWGLATSTGQNVGGTVYYAGGGGGQGKVTAGVGGYGGGANGKPDSTYPAISGAANTGGGGGGGGQGQTSAEYSGSNGGSGIVIVRYTKTSVGG